MIKINDNIIDKETKIELINCYNEFIAESNNMKPTKKLSIIEKIINWLKK